MHRLRVFGALFGIRFLERLIVLIPDGHVVVAGWARVHDCADVVARVKHSALVQRALYRKLGGERPEMPAEDVAFMHEQVDAEIADVESEFAINLRQRWYWL